MNNIFLSIITIVLSINMFLPSALLSRPSSYPYISGDTFRAFCDYIYDDTIKTVEPDRVQNGNKIFVKTEYLQEFFIQVHPKIANSYILITHNNDGPIPERFGYMLDDPKIIAWFGQNVENYSHPKLHPIPIGLANRYWKHGSIETVEQAQKVAGKCEKNILLYMNFAPVTYPSLRNYVYQLFKNQPYCLASGSKEFSSYLLDLAHCKFVLSPRGNGLDCHRTWESLYMGAFPIVESSSMDPLFQGLPVVIINAWTEVTQEFLEAKWEEMRDKEYRLDRIYADYWFNRIASYQVVPE